MKQKRLFLLVILGVILAFSFVLTACSNETDPIRNNGVVIINPFIGTWVSDDGEMIFTETTWTYTNFTDSSYDSYGTYTYSGVTALVIVIGGAGIGEEYTITISDNTFLWDDILLFTKVE